MSKEERSTEKIDPTAESDVLATIPDKYRGTAADRHDMAVLGKIQVLRRNFRLVTMLGFSSTAVASWEIMPIFLIFSLIDGGPPVVFWGVIIGCVGYSLVYASLAEMASMCPTAGGQYHWVSEFAPPRFQKQLSYAVGWLTAIGWQVYLAGTTFIVGTVIQGLIVLNVEDYVFHRWHATLLTIAVISSAVVVNVLLAKTLPVIQKAALALHLVGSFAIIIPLWVTADHGNAREVLLLFSDNGGWGNTGLSSMIGIVIPMGVLTGYDCIAHMSEETEDASRIIPVAMASSVSLNMVLIFLTGITLIFCLGDLDAALNSPTGQPFLEIFYQATQSKAGTTIMTVVILVLIWSCCVNEIATSSRQLWSFGRDRGVPGSVWLSRVSGNIPLRAVFVSFTITVLLSLINLGSSVALNAINSLGGVAILSSYTISISCVIWRRLHGASLPPRRWSLGRYGLAVNIAAILFLIPVLFFFFWPLAQPVTVVNLNWSSVMFGSILLIALGYYILKARHEYTGPVAQVKRS